MRGDHAVLPCRRCKSGGLPPRARGSRRHPPKHRSQRRPTPACAGITRAACRRSAPPRAYPRVRGDHLMPVSRAVLLRGLPPRARGSQLVRAAAPHRQRPTPACAGITAPTSGATGATSAYPRVRGDHGGYQLRGCRPAGLPPRARGSRAQADQCGVQLRPTPACAGITPSPPFRCSLGLAYPRVRGDHVASGVGEHLLAGLPPRARGSPST